ncbi:MAG: ABC transporter ATP-binding protein [Gammaproteobacteria bacterium]|nr:ABC transporter ATP-binding protein [Gammaproteobacteria bacterium]
MAEKEVRANNIISLESVRKQYGKDTVLHDINFNVQAGESIVLVGHNGAGKTTLMKLMLGLTRPTSGTVEVLKGNPVLSTAVEQRLSLGYLPESVAFYDAMTGREVLSFYAALKGASQQECSNLLELVGLSDASKRKVATYSKRMRQRLGLAQAMLGDPQLLFLDEPTTGLDPLLRQHFYELIDKQHKKGATSIISSHALSEVEARANRFVILKKGVLVACGTLDELYQQVSLPTRINLKVQAGQASVVAERLGSDARIQKVNELDKDGLTLLCSKQEKMPLIRYISNLGEVVQDMQVIPPRLDEIYSYFMSGATA